jgi:hypothetical protein
MGLSLKNSAVAALAAAAAGGGGGGGGDGGGDGVDPCISAAAATRVRPSFHLALLAGAHSGGWSYRKIFSFENQNIARTEERKYLNYLPLLHILGPEPS